LDQVGSVFCFVSPARCAGSSWTYAKHAAHLIRPQYWCAGPEENWKRKCWPQLKGWEWAACSA